MRKTRLQYHAAIRDARKSETDIVNKRFAAAVVENRHRDFWQEVKRLRSRSNVVDGLSSASDIAESFAGKYSTLYTSVSYSVEKMSKIRGELNGRLHTSGSVQHSVVSTGNVLSAFKLLKAGKGDGSFGLSTYHFIHACEELGTHVAMRFSALLVDGFAPKDMVSCTLIPIPKGKNVITTDSANYRGIALISIFRKVFDLIF